MTCIITKGRKNPCRDKVAGLYKIFICTSANTISGLTYTHDNISGGTFQSIYEYELKGQNSFVQTMKNENGTTYVEQVLTINLRNLSSNDNNEIKLLTFNPGFPVFVQYNDGGTVLGGKDFGFTVQTAESNSGIELGDGFAYTITMMAKEKIFANTVANSTLADPLGDAEGTIVKGI
jgi:hypothetical protein